MQISRQILVSELFTIDKPLGLQMMKYNTLHPPLPHRWPSQMPQLFAASRGHSHYYASHPGPHWSIHHSGIILSPSCHGFILQIKLLTMPGAPGPARGPGDRLLLLMSVKGGAIPGDWPAHVARHHKTWGRTIHPWTQGTPWWGGEGIPLSVLTRGIEQTQKLVN